MNICISKSEIISKLQSVDAVNAIGIVLSSMVIEPFGFTDDKIYYKCAVVDQKKFVLGVLKYNLVYKNKQ
jgi:hypothetical protein